MLSTLHSWLRLGREEAGFSLPYTFISYPAANFYLRSIRFLAAQTFVMSNIPKMCWRSWNDIIFSIPKHIFTLHFC